MADRTVRISQLAWQRFKQSALNRGITLKAYLEELAVAMEIVGPPLRLRPGVDVVSFKPSFAPPEGYEWVSFEGGWTALPIAGTHARRLAAREEA